MQQTVVTAIRKKYSFVTDKKLGLWSKAQHITFVTVQEMCEKIHQQSYTYINLSFVKCIQSTLYSFWRYITSGIGLQRFDEMHRKSITYPLMPLIWTSQTYITWKLSPFLPYIRLMYWIKIFNRRGKKSNRIKSKIKKIIVAALMSIYLCITLIGY